MQNATLWFIYDTYAKQIIDAIFLEFSKAIDRGPHQRLMCKFCTINICTQMYSYRYKACQHAVESWCSSCLISLKICNSKQVCSSNPNYNDTVPST